MKSSLIIVTKWLCLCIGHFVHNSHASEANWPCLPKKVETRFKIYSLTQAKVMCKIHEKVKLQLLKDKYAKVICPFGVLIVATSEYPDEYLRLFANMVANIVDLNNDGLADDPKVIKALAHGGVLHNGGVLICGKTAAEEQRGQAGDLGQRLLDPYECQTYKSGGDLAFLRAIVFEEAFHLVQGGYKVAYPDQFGWSWESTVCKEAARLQCVKPGWWHPENQCPKGAPFKPGHPAKSPLKKAAPNEGEGCLTVDCDCVEFYRQAVTAYMDWNEPKEFEFWYSPYMPRTKQAFEAMASQEILELMRDPKYHQPQKPLTLMYKKSGMQGTLGDDDGMCKANCMKCSSQPNTGGSNQPNNGSSNQPNTGNDNDNGGLVICPGNDPADYCDCAGDCTNNSRFCACKEAQVCCGNGPSRMSRRFKSTK